ncbi:hypothetical protein EVG20_g10719, partial [Dentipellis fragilis]
RDGINALLYCEESSATLQYSIPIDFSAIIFEVDARIEPTYCYLTPDRDQDHPYTSEAAPNDKFTSSWFRTPSDAREDVTAWRRALVQLERIVKQATDTGAALSELVAPDYSQGSESPLAFLQVGWRPPKPYTLEYLPVFTADHEHYPIPTLAAVLFEKRVRVRFVLHGVPAKADAPAIIGARMLYVHILD